MTDDDQLTEDYKIALDRAAESAWRTVSGPDREVHLERLQLRAARLGLKLDTELLEGLVGNVEHAELFFKGRTAARDYRKTGGSPQMGLLALYTGIVESENISDDVKRWALPGLYRYLDGNTEDSLEVCLDLKLVKDDGRYTKSEQHRIDLKNLSMAREIDDLILAFGIEKYAASMLVTLRNNKTVDSWDSVRKLSKPEWLSLIHI